MSDGGVAKEDLHQEQPHHHHRREQTLAPDPDDPQRTEELQNYRIRKKINALRATHAGKGKHRISHPWPPVKGVVEQHHSRRRPLPARVNVTRAAARSYALNEWHS